MSSRTRIVGAFLAIYLIWGSTYLAIRFAVQTIPPFLMAGTRFLLAGLLLYLWLWLRGERRTTPLQWREAAMVGGLMLLGGNGIVSWAERVVPSGLTALVISSIPIWVVLLEWLWLRGPRPNRETLLGLGLGMAGVAMLVRPDAAGVDVPLWGTTSLLLASGLWAAGGLYSRRAALPSSSLLAAAMEMITGGALCLVVGTVLGEWRKLDLHAVSGKSIFSLAYLVLFGSLVALTSYLWLLRVVSPANAATYAFVNPVVAVVLGWALAGETLGASTAVAAVVVIGGVILIVLGRSRIRAASALDAAHADPAARRPG